MRECAGQEKRTFSMEGGNLVVETSGPTATKDLQKM